LATFRISGRKHAIERWQCLMPYNLLLSHDNMFVKLSPVAICVQCCSGLDVKKCCLLQKWESHLQCHKCWRVLFYEWITTLCLLVCQNKLPAWFTLLLWFLLPSLAFFIFLSRVFFFYTFSAALVSSPVLAWCTGCVLWMWLPLQPWLPGDLGIGNTDNCSLKTLGLLSDRYTFCQKCFNDIPGDTVTLGDDPTQPQT
jgi:hypothetical protein